MTLPNISRRARPGLGKFLADQRGMSAVEFALLLPFMVLLYLGGVEVAQAVSINRMIALTSSTVTNLVSQYTTISAANDMPDILNSSAQIMTPYSGANTKVIVSAIAIDAQGQGTVTWSQALHGTARVAGSNVSVPAGLNTPNTTIILGEASYAYTPTIDFMHLGMMTISSSIFMLPRSSPTITLTQ
jgi:Flp pilus assembly protein TadG